MIDVWAVCANALWILGLALFLAVVSWAYWRALEEGTAMRTVVRRPTLRRGVDLALLLFCAGLAATSGRLWERVVWGVLAAVWVVQAGLAGRGNGTQINRDSH